MTDFNILWNRIGLITAIISELQSRSVGRTAIMKLLYILQTVKGVPLNYDFRLYTYGPFDSEVLSDLDYAVSLDALSSDITYNANGYNYNIQLSEAAGYYTEKASDFLEEHRDEIEWVVNKFSHKSARDLELLSTTIFVDRAFSNRRESVDVEKLAQQVKEIKPRFKDEEIKAAISFLMEMETIRSIQNRID